VLRKAQKKLISQIQAAAELEITTRQVRRLLRRLKKEGDKAVVHKLRGLQSNRKTEDKTREKIVRILSGEVYRGFGPTLASEYLSAKQTSASAREALRQIMMSAGLWRGRRRRIEPVHQWRRRRSCRGELVQWDTSTHDWLEGRGETIYLIHMIERNAGQNRPGELSRLLSPKPLLGSFTKAMDPRFEQSPPCAPELLTSTASLEGSRGLLRSQPRRLGFGFPFGRDPVRTHSP
jgi:hypothetical protein